MLETFSSSWYYASLGGWKDVGMKAGALAAANLVTSAGGVDPTPSFGKLG